MEPARDETLTETTLPAAAPRPKPSSRKQKRRRKVEEGIASPAFGRNLFRTMVALALIVLAFAAYNMRFAAVVYGFLMPGMPVDEVRYLRGAPESISADGLVWTYAEGSSAKSKLRFDGADRLVSIACSSTSSDRLGCPDVAGLNLGTSEDWLINRLGPPTSYRYIPDGKIMVYSDMGLAFNMRQYRVDGIAKFRKSGSADYLPRIFWHMLP